MSFHSRNIGSLQCAAHEARAQLKASSHSCYSPKLPCRHRQDYIGDHTLQSHAFAFAANDNAAIPSCTVTGLSVVAGIPGRQPMTGQQSTFNGANRFRREISANGVNGGQFSTSADNGVGHAGKHLPV